MKGVLHELYRACPRAACSIGLGEPHRRAERRTNGSDLRVIAKNGEDVKAITYSPSRIALTSVVEYPDQRSAMKTVAEMLALGTLEFVEIEPQWDVAEFTGLVREA
jgi:hypothetical protein